MKATLKIVLPVLALASISIFAHAGVGQFENEKTTCYVFKNNKLASKSSCTYGGAAGGNGYGAFFNASFKVKGYKEFEVVNSVSWEYSNGNTTKSEELITLNNKKAELRHRDIKSLKVLPKTDYKKRQTAYLNKWNKLGWEKADKPSWVDCYYQKSSGLEFCHVYKPHG